MANTFSCIMLKHSKCLINKSKLNKKTKLSQREWLILWEGSRKGNIQNWFEKLGIFQYSKAGEAVSKLIDMINHLALFTLLNLALTVHFVKENQPCVLPRTLLPFYLLTPRPSLAHTCLYKFTLVGAWVSAHTVFVFPDSGSVGPGVWGSEEDPASSYIPMPSWITPNWNQLHPSDEQLTHQFFLAGLK